LDVFSFDSSVAFPQLSAHLTKYQNPQEADAITKLQSELDETKIILHNTISAILQRGEKLDDLVAKSDDLSAQSKVFYKTARKTNQCCQLL
jgi:synaptobrevin family protein YKT6